MLVVLEWLSTLVSFAGTALIATHHGVGWWLCFWADIGFVVFAIRRTMWGFLTLCAGYGALNLIGAFNK